VSVINKMLRDLDSRQAAPLANAPAPRHGLVRDTQVIGRSVSPGSLSRRYWLAVVSLATLVLGSMALAGWWYLAPRKPAPSAQNAAMAIAPVVPPALAKPTPQVEPPTPVADPGGPGRSVMALKMENLLRQAPELPSSTKPMAPTAPRVAPDRVPSELRTTRVKQPELAPVSAVRAKEMASVTSATSSPSAQPLPQSSSMTTRPSPALEALAQAQGLWNAGSRDAALDLLREALVLAERSPASNTAALGPLARELARMELAEGQVSQALEMLTRLEPALSGSADVWALRGNAAQRLGRHQESAAAYLMALKLRPDEPRWMLGAAVSLAAQGQTASAAEWAEKARSAGVLSREVATYLRQLGVPLRER
jgi:MSHA biogenesis protein MshN